MPPPGPQPRPIDDEDERPEPSRGVSRRRMLQLAGGLGAATVLATGVAGAWWLTRRGWSLVSTLRGHTDFVNSVTFSPNGELAASCSADDTVRVWRVADGALLQTFDTDGFAERVAISPNGRFIAYSASINDTASGTLAWVASVQDGSKTPLKGERPIVTVMAFSPDGRLIAGGGEDLPRPGGGRPGGAVSVWRTTDGGLERTFDGLGHEVSAVAFAPDNRRLAAGCSLRPSTSPGSDPVRVWDVITGNQEAELGGHADEVSSLAFNIGSLMLATGSLRGENPARVFRVSGGTPVASFGPDLRSALHVSFTPGGDSLLTGSGDGTLREWRLSGSAAEVVAALNDDRQASVGYAPDGRMMASVPNDGTGYDIRVWRAS